MIVVNRSSYILYSIWFCQGCFNTVFNIHLQYRGLSGTETALILSFALDVRQNEGQTGQAAPSSIVLDVAKMHLDDNSFLRIPYVEASSLAETHSNPCNSE